jgi:hypothetical protein
MDARSAQWLVQTTASRQRERAKTRRPKPWFVRKSIGSKELCRFDLGRPHQLRLFGRSSILPAKYWFNMNSPNTQAGTLDEKTFAAQQACIDHARDLLSSARAVQAVGHHNIAYHLAALAAKAERDALLRGRAICQPTVPISKSSLAANAHTSPSGVDPKIEE